MISIKRIKSEDLTDAGMVYSKAWQASHKGIVSADYLVIHSSEYKQEALKAESEITCNEIYLLRDNNVPIGIISLNIELGEIKSLYIAPEFWRKGYGRKLLDFAVRRLNNFESLFLIVMNKNLKARGFYERYGFINTGEEKILSVDKGISEMKYTYAIDGLRNNYEN